MFDIGFIELALTAIIALVVIGPKRLPETIRTVGLWVGRTKRALNRAYQEMDRELGLDDIRRQLHNEEVMRSLEEHKKQLEAEILGSTQPDKAGQDNTTPAAESPTSASATDITTAMDEPTEADTPDSGDTAGTTAPVQKGDRHE